MKRIFIILLSFFITLTTALATKLEYVKELKNNVILIKLDEEAKFKSSLSDDKKNISIEIFNFKKPEKELKIKTDSKLIKDVYVQQKEDNVLINVILSKRSGFNTFQLPYSTSIVVDVFNWDEITQSEDKYRSGLFAYESKLYNEADDYFENSKDSLVDAKAMLGLVQLLQDSVNTAYDNLFEAAEQNTYLPDIYAALAQIYSETNRPEDKKLYESKFFEKLTGKKDTTFEYPKLIFSTENLDSLKAPSMNEIAKKDSVTNDEMNDRFPNLFSENDKAKDSINKENTEKSLFADSFTDLLIYGIFAVVLLSIMLISLYFKWRKEKRKSEYKNANKDFEDQLQDESDKINKNKGTLLDKSISSYNSNEQRPAEDTADKSEAKEETKTENLNTIGKRGFNIESSIENKIKAKEELENIKETKEINDIKSYIGKYDSKKLKKELYKKFNVKND